MKVKFKNKRHITKLWKDNLVSFSNYIKFFDSNRVGESNHDDKKLSLWVSDQRVLFNTSQLTENEYIKLDNKKFNFNPKKKTESELLYELESVIRKSIIVEYIDKNKKSEFSLWYKNKEKQLYKDIDLYNSEDDNDRFLKLMIRIKKITKEEIRTRKNLYSWCEKCNFIEDLMINKEERIIKSKYPIEYRWIIYTLDNKDKMTTFKSNKFKKIENKFNETIEEEKKTTNEKKQEKNKQLKIDPTSTTYKYKNCASCGNNIYSLRGECVKCVSVRDQESKENRKNKDINLFNAKIAAQSAKRKANKLKATPKWLTKKDYEKIEEIYLLAQKRSEKESIEYNVDHIIPLVGKDYVKQEDGTMRYMHVVCGLHSPLNMQVILAEKNKSKQARFDMSYHDENKFLKDLKKGIIKKL